MRIKKLIDNLIIPTKAYPFDAGIDVYAPAELVIRQGEVKQIKLGFAIEIEFDEMILMSERSGMAIKCGITSIGNVIDCGYRGEVSIILYNASKEPFFIWKGDKIGQMLVCKLGARTIEVVDELTTTDRGDKAHYSSGL